MSSTLDTLLTVTELAARYDKSQSTLANWRSAGIGPAYIKIGKKVFYPEKGVAAYERGQVVKAA